MLCNFNSSNLILFFSLIFNSSIFFIFSSIIFSLFIFSCLSFEIFSWSFINSSHNTIFFAISSLSFSFKLLNSSLEKLFKFCGLFLFPKFISLTESLENKDKSSIPSKAFCLKSFNSFILTWSLVIISRRLSNSSSFSFDFFLSFVYFKFNSEFSS